MKASGANSTITDTGSLIDHDEQDHIRTVWTILDLVGATVAN